jgi:hypothetical protein
LAVEVVFAAVFVDEVFEEVDVFVVAAGAGAGAGFAAGAGAGVEVVPAVFEAAGVEEVVEPPDAAVESVVDFLDRDFFVVVLPSAVVELPEAVELAGAAAVVPDAVPEAGVSVVDFFDRDFLVVVPEASVDPPAAVVESVEASVVDFFFLLLDVEPVVLSVVDALWSAEASVDFLLFFLLVLVPDVEESDEVVDESSVDVVDFFFFFGFGVLSSVVDCVVLDPVVDCVVWCATARKSAPVVNNRNAAAITNKRLIRIVLAIWNPFFPLERDFHRRTHEVCASGGRQL